MDIVYSVHRTLHAAESDRWCKNDLFCLWYHNGIEKIESNTVKQVCSLKH